MIAGCQCPLCQSWLIATPVPPQDIFTTEALWNDYAASRREWREAVPLKGERGEHDTRAI